VKGRSLITCRTEAEFIRGPSNPEDMARCPGTDWIVTSGHSGFMPDPQGHLYLVHATTRQWEELFPGEVVFAPDRDRYGDVAPPQVGMFDAHGLSLRSCADGIHTIYVVNHGGRESVEIFRLDCCTGKPSIAWVGAVIMPEWCSANDGAPHPDGGFLVTNLCTSIGENLDKLGSGEPCGSVLRWTSKDAPLAVVAGSELSRPNGVEVSADGEWCFINSWPVRKVVKLSLNRPVREKYELDVDFMPDNLTWTDDRKFLLTTGQRSTALEVFTTYSTMTAEELIWYDNSEEFGLASAALIVGEEIWVGTARNDGIAIFPYPQ
jgi:hypothetical protein